MNVTNVELSDEEREDCAFALVSWANHIETGNPVLTVNDLVLRGRQKEIRALEPGQVETVAKLRRLAGRFLKN